MTQEISERRRGDRTLTLVVFYFIDLIRALCLRVVSDGRLFMTFVTPIVC